ncbi:hypothetical protein TNCV_82951 [Trichonephila clavipes]|nr:hypothetical protein TNCV_82951 [Trichonephila clavipes]
MDDACSSVALGSRPWFRITKSVANSLRVASECESHHPSPFSRRYSREDYPPPAGTRPHLSPPYPFCNNSERERESMVHGLVPYLPATRDVPVGEFILYPYASIDCLHPAPGDIFSPSVHGVVINV